MEKDQDCGQNTFEFLENADQNIASSKMFTICSVTELEGFCKTFPKSGMIRLTRSSIPSFAEFHKGGAEFTFWESATESPITPIFSNVEDVLDQRLNGHRQVSKRAALGYLRRQSENDKPLPILLNNALMNLINAESPAQ